MRAGLTSKGAVATRAAWCLGAVSLVAVMAHLALRNPEGGGSPQSIAATEPEVTLPALAGANAAPHPLDEPTGDAARVSAEQAAALTQRLFTEGSLRHARPDGSWGIGPTGELLPSMALRRRFDQWLTTIGEINIAQISAMLKLQATQDLGTAGAEQVMAVWQRYLKLQRQRWKTSLDGRDMTGWDAALAERQQVRRDVLGIAWAEAFYAEEEAALRQHMAGQQARAGLPGQVAGISQPALSTLPALSQAPAPGADARLLHQQRTAAFGAEAAQRLQEEDEAQATWARKLAQARTELARLEAAPELSPLQKQQAIDAWLDGQFQGGERLRARALLGR